jgi:hypothetical protein
VPKDWVAGARLLFDEYNTAVGYLSLLSNTEGQFNTAIGAGALPADVGSQDAFYGSRNTAIGAAALFSNTTDSVQ